jgi:hypothetical protein
MFKKVVFPSSEEGISTRLEHICQFIHTFIERPLQRPGVTWLVDAEFPAAGKRHLRQGTPVHVVHRTARDIVLLHLGNESLDVVAHQVELVDVVPFGGMYGNFGWRQSKDQPAAADVDVGNSRTSLNKARSASGLVL